jgi:hypothetical protein
MAKFTKGKGTPRDGRICIDCGRDLSQFREGSDVRHCAGISYAFGARKWGEPHHCIVLHQRCWLCHEPLGCLLCSGIEAELLCENIRHHGDLGAVWGTKAAFLEHGPLPQQPKQNKARPQAVADYPPEWTRWYTPIEADPIAVAAMKKRMGISG